MRTVGLVTEYNPFHNGHAYHLQMSKKITEADAAVAVMSGNFLQRGEPAIADKRARAEMALAAGCDLVLELPVAYSAQPAQWFAHGAIAVLDATGVVDAVCFGTESGDLDALRRAADRVADEPEAFADRLRGRLKRGLPYPTAYAEAAADLLRDAGEADAVFALSQPNHTLGLHYLLALRRLGSAIRPYAIRRIKADYRQTEIADAAIASATALRKLLLDGGGSPDALAPYVPPSTLRILRREIDAGRAPVTWESFAGALFHLLHRDPAAEWSRYAEVTEGLEHRIRRVLPRLRERSVAALLEALKTKRYTQTKLQRTLLRILLGHDREELSPQRLAEPVPYIRVLGFSERGQALLRRMKRTARAPVVHTAAEGDWPLLAMDARAAAVYALACRGDAAADPGLPWRDYREAPVRLV